MQKFDPVKGLVEVAAAERDVSADLTSAETIIKGLKAPMFVEDLIKHVQSTCSLTNNEVYGLIQKVDAELKPQPKVVELNTEIS